MIAIGPTAFGDFLSGYEIVDNHFATTPFEDNIPVLLGLLDVWYATFMGYSTRAVLPYEQYLHRFPAYLQQLLMESNGKCVRKDGTPISYQTSPVVWGEPGTNGQHSFHQLLHQGTQQIPADFIVFAQSNDPYPSHHDKLVANCFAQAEALAFGVTDETLRGEHVSENLIAHKRMPGNRPSTLVLGTRLTPSTLGQLIALYEHRTFVQGVVWGINSFDQYGVELGKKLAGIIYRNISEKSDLAEHDPSTTQAIEWYRKKRRG